MEEKNMSKVQVMDHPLIQHKVNYIRSLREFLSSWACCWSLCCSTVI